LHQGRAGQSGFWLAAAISYKSTPLLFLPLLMWKRQWRVCGWTLGFVLLLNIGPALWLGWSDTIDYHRRWLARAWQCASEPDPSSHVVEPPKQHNQSLKSALARLVQTYPPGHLLHLEHPWFVQFGNLDVGRARRFVSVATLLILAAIGWRMRRRGWEPAQRPTDLGIEWAATGLLAALLSPLCWKQHLVLTVPVMYLVIRHQLLQRTGQRTAKAAAVADDRHLRLCRTDTADRSRPAGQGVGRAGPLLQGLHLG
jgi:hypothetical protein